MVSQGGPPDQGNYRPPSKVEKVHHLFLPKPNKDQQSIVTIYIPGCEDPLFTDFIRRCLEWDPATRMTPNAALR